MAIYRMRKTALAATYVTYDKSVLPGWLAKFGDLVKGTATRSQEAGLQYILKPLQDVGLVKFSISKYNRKTKKLSAKITELGDEARKITINCQSKTMLDAIDALIIGADNDAAIWIDKPLHGKADLLTDKQII